MIRQIKSAAAWSYTYHQIIIRVGVAILVLACIADVVMVQMGYRSISRDVWLFDCSNPFSIVGGIVLSIGLMWLVGVWWAAGIIAALATHLFILPLEISTLPPIQHKRGDIGPNELSVWMTAINGMTTAIAAAVTCWTLWVGYLKIRDAKKSS